MFRTVPLLRTCAPSRCISQLSRSGKIIANMKLNTFIPMATTSHIIINIIDDTNTLSTKSAIQQAVLEFCNDHDNVKFISSRYHEDKTYARIVHSPNSLDLYKLKKYAAPSLGKVEISVCSRHEYPVKDEEHNEMILEQEKIVEGWTKGGWKVIRDDQWAKANPYRHYWH